MVLFTGLLITLVVAVLAVTIVALMTGAGFFIVFGDVIVCMAIMVWLIKRLIKRNRGS